LELLAQHAFDAGDQAVFVGFPLVRFRSRSLSGTRHAGFTTREHGRRRALLRGCRTLRDRRLTVGAACESHALSRRRAEEGAIRKLGWFIMTFLALGVAAYAVVVVLIPNAGPPFVRDHRIRLPWGC
jgi:hypothetical protein